MPLLPSELGGETAASLLQGSLNRDLHAKRRSQGIGTGPINSESGMTNVEIWQEEPVKKKEKLFTTYKDKGEQEVAPDRTQSLPNEGKLVFSPLPSHNAFSNPSKWKLKLRLNIRTGNPAGVNNLFTGPDNAVNHVAAEEDDAVDGTWHMRLANNCSSFIAHKCRVIFNNNKDLNETDETWVLRSWLTWLLNTKREQKDSVKSQCTQFSHSSTAGGLIHKVGRVRARQNASLWSDVPEQCIEARRCEEYLHYQLADNQNNQNSGVDVIISPLPGPFFAFDEKLPGSFTPRVELDLWTARGELRRWIIAQRAVASEDLADFITPANNDRPYVTIDMDKTKLIIPYHSYDEDTSLAHEAKLLAHEKKPYDTRKVIRVWSSNTFTTRNNVDGEGIDLDPMPALNGQLPDQFGIGFIRDAFVRGNGVTLLTEKMLFERNGIDRFQIFLGTRPIFESGPLDWRNTFTNNIRLWEMQTDYWGKEGNDERINHCCKEPQDMPFGQKWVWCSINPNYDGANEVIERLDTPVTVRIWADQIVANLRCVFFIPQSINYVCNDLISNDWTGPEFPLTPAYPEKFPKNINASGGRQWT